MAMLNYQRVILETTNHHQPDLVLSIKGTFLYMGMDTSSIQLCQYCHPHNQMTIQFTPSVPNIGVEDHGQGKVKQEIPIKRTNNSN